MTVAPAAPRLIDRDDLLATLDRAAAKKVTIISAPAGSGKTSLLRAWARRPGRLHQLAVVSVQRDEHDAQQFWLALLDAVRHASATADRAEPQAATPDFNAPAMVDRVLSELADARARGQAADQGERPSPGSGDFAPPGTAAGHRRLGGQLSKPLSAPLLVRDRVSAAGHDLTG
jgi:hypothetical protein